MKRSIYSLCLGLLSASFAIADAGDLPNSFKIPGSDTSLVLGGYVKGDLIYDASGSPDSIRAETFVFWATIPLEGQSGDGDQNFRAHARQTRFNIATYTPTDYGTLKVFFETDLLGVDGNESVVNSEGLRVRHAYGELGGFLLGQAWTTFSDFSVYPETVDFGATAGRTLLRQGQLRYTYPMGKSKFEFAIENPDGDFDPGPDAESIENKAPDLIMTYRNSGDYGTFSLRGVGRLITVDTATGDDEEFGFGIASGLKLNLGDKDDLRLDVKYGDGIGRYVFDVAIGNNSFGFDGADIKAQTVIAAHASIRHWWTETVRSNLVGGYVNIDNEDFLGPDVNENIISAHANVIWDVTKKVRVGLEYIYGQRETEGGLEGEMHRIQTGAWFFL